MFEGGGGGVNTAAAVYELYLGVSVSVLGLAGGSTDIGFQ